MVRFMTTSCHLAIIACLGFTGLPLAAELSADVASPLVRKGHAGWRYWDKAERPPAEWTQADFEDEAWAQGDAPLGYGEDIIETEIDFGGKAEEKHPAAYFRLLFEAPKPEAFPAWIAEIRCDDGAVIYLNGKEVYRYNMDGGDLSEAAKAHAMVEAGQKLGIVVLEV